MKIKDMLKTCADDYDNRKVRLYDLNKKGSLKNKVVVENNIKDVLADKNIQDILTKDLKEWECEWDSGGMTINIYF